VLEATGDIKLALGLTDNNPALLVYKANQRVAVRTVISLEANADTEQRCDAVRRAREEIVAYRYLVRRWQALTGGSALHGISGRSFDDLACEAEAADAG
jgi:hypothetical protein